MQKDTRRTYPAPLAALLAVGAIELYGLGYFIGPLVREMFR